MYPFFDLSQVNILVYMLLIIALACLIGAIILAFLLRFGFAQPEHRHWNIEWDGRPIEEKTGPEWFDEMQAIEQ